MPTPSIIKLRKITEKYQCSICDKVYSNIVEAQRCYVRGQTKEYFNTLFSRENNWVVGDYFLCESFGGRYELGKVVDAFEHPNDKHSIYPKVQIIDKIVSNIKFVSKNIVFLNKDLIKFMVKNSSKLEKICIAGEL